MKNVLFRVFHVICMCGLIYAETRGTHQKTSSYAPKAIDLFAKVK